MEKPRDSKGRFIKGIHYFTETEFKNGQRPINFGRGQFKKGHPGYLKHSNETSFKKGHTPWIKGKKGMRLSPKTEFKKGDTPWIKGKFGEKCPSWKGGRTAIAENIRKSEKYKEWRLAIYAKHDFTCKICGERGGNTKFEAHHNKPLVQIIKENKIKTMIGALCCKELWDMSNGITLCNKCHNLTKHGRKKI